HETLIVMHNDAVLQGLSELPFMRDYERWGVLTIGTGLGNARFTNRRKTPAEKRGRKGRAPGGAWVGRRPGREILLLGRLAGLRGHRARCAGGRRRVLHDLEQLDVEDERGARLDLRRRAAIAVGHVGGADDLRLAARLHLTDALGPALDDLVEREGGRLAALDRAVEHGAVGELAGVVHLHLVGGLRRVAGARLLLDVDHARVELLRALLLRHLVEERLPPPLLPFPPR